MKRKWWTITYYFNDINDWIGKTSYNSKIFVNNIDDQVVDKDSAYKYADLIRGNRNLWYTISNGKIK